MNSWWTRSLRGGPTSETLLVRGLPACMRIALALKQRRPDPRLVRARPLCRELLLAAPQAEADASEGHENRSQGSSQEWESGVREGCPGADAAGCCRTTDLAGGSGGRAAGTARATLVGRSRARGAGRVAT